METGAAILLKKVLRLQRENPQWTALRVYAQTTTRVQQEKEEKRPRNQIERKNFGKGGEKEK